MNPRALLRSGAACAALLVLAACAAGTPASPPAPTAAPSAAAPGPAGPKEIHWYRTAAEQRALFEQVYAWAGARVEEAARRLPAGAAWGVILDADETVLDNSAYQVRRARLGLGYTEDSWNEWVREEAATALPGAAAFVAKVKSLGGHVAIVTNRVEAVCDETRRNLAARDLVFDVVLCRRPGPSEKETRFRMVQEGTTSAGLPPLQVVAWVGDNIHDFPGGSQELRDADPARLADFGTRFFLLPNPMYGSWEGNPPR